jgi:hypothetical protein
MQPRCCWFACVPALSFPVTGKSTLFSHSLIFLTTARIYKHVCVLKSSCKMCVGGGYRIFFFVLYFLPSWAQDAAGAASPEKVLSKTFSAFIAAVHVDQGAAAARGLVHAHVLQEAAVELPEVSERAKVSLDNLLGYRGMVGCFFFFFFFFFLLFFFLFSFFFIFSNKIPSSSSSSSAQGNVQAPARGRSRVARASVRLGCVQRRRSARRGRRQLDQTLRANGRDAVPRAPLLQGRRGPAAGPEPGPRRAGHLLKRIQNKQTDKKR